MSTVHYCAGGPWCHPGEVEWEQWSHLSSVPLTFYGNFCVQLRTFKIVLDQNFLIFVLSFVENESEHARPSELSGFVLASAEQDSAAVLACSPRC
jgi:hypothetical protein